MTVIKGLCQLACIWHFSDQCKVGEGAMLYLTVSTIVEVIWHVLHLTWSYARVVLFLKCMPTYF